ncbi:hypothetical protein J6590_032585 [Homalodisca vitripennis]|nr:hypothetical protein J6590_032585 [Homalodisca vitripennis]
MGHIYAAFLSSRPTEQRPGLFLCQIPDSRSPEHLASSRVGWSLSSISDFSNRNSPERLSTPLTIPVSANHSHSLSVLHCSHKLLHASSIEQEHEINLGEWSKGFALTPPSVTILLLSSSFIQSQSSSSCLDTLSLRWPLSDTLSIHQSVVSFVSTFTIPQLNEDPPCVFRHSPFPTTLPEDFIYHASLPSLRLNPQLSIGHLKSLILFRLPKSPLFPFTKSLKLKKTRFFLKLKREFIKSLQTPLISLTLPHNLPDTLSLCQPISTILSQSQSSFDFLIVLQQSSDTLILLEPPSDESRSISLFHTLLFPSVSLTIPF